MYINEQINTDEMPKIETIEFQSISRNYQKLLIFNVLLIYTVAIAFLFASTYFAKFEIESIYFWLIFSVLTCFVIFLLSFSIYGFSKRKYALRTHDILYTQGVLVNKLTTVAYNRIQHIEVSSGLIERKLDLATLSIYTAGDSGSDLVIRGLNNVEANRITAFLSARMNG